MSTVHEVRAKTSLISTVLNEERSIAAFLSSVELQTIHPSEILVVDGGSTDHTTQLLRDWSPSCGCRVRVTIAPGAGISAGRNLAISQASHEHLVVADAGTVPSPDWFAEITAPWQEDPDAVIGGFFEPVGDTFWPRAIAVVITPTVEEIDPSTFLPSSRSVAFPRSLWHAAGGYPEWLDYCEDLVFDLEMKRIQPVFVFAPDAIVAWIGRPNLAQFAKQYYRYARGDGKARLFGRRHLLRYSAYTFAVASWVISPWLVGAGAIAFVGYLTKPWRRVWARRATFSTPSLVAAFAVAPVIVVFGDIAKMAGYPPGIIWRSRQRRGNA